MVDESTSSSSSVTIQNVLIPVDKPDRDKIQLPFSVALIMMKPYVEM